jgi:hypothetical protein
MHTLIVRHVMKLWRKSLAPPPSNWPGACCASSSVTAPTVKHRMAGRPVSKRQV